MTARAPEHVRRATETHRLAMFAWLAERERVCRGHINGSEAREYAELHPAPRYADALDDVCAERRGPGPSEPVKPAATNVVDLSAWLGTTDRAELAHNERNSR